MTLERYETMLNTQCKFPTTSVITSLDGRLPDSDMAEPMKDGRLPDMAEPMKPPRGKEAQ